MTPEKKMAIIQELVFCNHDQSENCYIQSSIQAEISLTAETLKLWHKFRHTIFCDE